MATGEQESNRLTKAVFEAIRYASKRDFPMTRTKLLKLLYLADLRAVDEGKAVRSEVNWVWYNYGPFDKQVLLVEDTLAFAGTIERTEVSGYSGKTYNLLRVPPESEEKLVDQTEWDREFFAILHRVIDEHGELSPTQLTRLAYETPPMKLAQEDNGERGVALDMSAGNRQEKKTSRQKLRSLRRLRERREEIRRRSDQGDLSFMRAEISETSGTRSAANRKLLL